MPYLRNYHVFISHSWDYPEPYNIVKGWLNSASNFNWSDYSVPFYNPLDANTERQLKKEIQEQISACSCVAIISGMYVSYSKWIEYEIDTAVSMGKPIIGIKPWGQERIPTKVSQNANVMVGWNSASVVQAIRDYSL